MATEDSPDDDECRVCPCRSVKNNRADRVSRRLYFGIAQTHPPQRINDIYKRNDQTPPVQRQPLRNGLYRVKKLPRRLQRLRRTIASQAPNNRPNNSMIYIY